MIVYYGSSKHFTNIKDLLDINDPNCNGVEGVGVYISTNIEIARTRGSYIYRIDLRNEYIKDFRNPGFAEDSISALCMIPANITGRTLPPDIRAELVESILTGNSVIGTLDQELLERLECYDWWYDEVTQRQQEEVSFHLSETIKRYTKVYTFSEGSLGNKFVVGVIKDLNSIFDFHCVEAPDSKYITLDSSKPLTRVEQIVTSTMSIF